MYKYFTFLALVFFGNILAQEDTRTSEVLSITPKVDGILLVPSAEKPPLAILIGGSGDIDRNGNSSATKNNALKFLAEGLYDNDIASFRYDKRIVKLIKARTVDERLLRLDDFIEDAVAIIEHFKNDDRFSKIYVIGHSQGSLVGMVAAQDRADGFVSIAGAGQEIDDVIVEQLAQQSPGLKENARLSFDDLRANGKTTNYSEGLSSIFRPQLQQFILSWMQYNPQTEIAELDMPVLIINGDKDLQVQILEAELLKEAKPEAEYKIIKNMNHVLKEIKGDMTDNYESYNRYDLPVIPELTNTISAFIKK